MSLLLTTPPVVEPLSLAEAKAHLRVPHADDDAYISTLIVSARLRVERQTGLRLITQNWSQFMDCWPPMALSSWISTRCLRLPT